MAHTDTLAVTALATGDNCTVIRVAGELDHNSEQLFLASTGSIAATGHPYLVLDVTALTFCDSRGLYSLLTLHWLLRRRDGALLLAGVGQRLGELLHQTGSGTVLAGYPSVSKALAAVPNSYRPAWPPRPATAD
ncbi:STAS domain-containing protein [Streptomyces sp. NPDC050738]|uniref:STAS domain-containing protein n=1 Tax=Streptomyces sp. NPDC050738 TaxID=3154744 RepID=UPI00342EE5FA